MSNQRAPIILKDDVFALTEKARQELGGAGTRLTAPELEVLVLLDGAATAGETAARVRRLRSEVVFDIIGKLLQDGLIELVKVEGGSLDFTDFFNIKTSDQPEAADAATEQNASATALLLQQQGFVVRIARRPAVKRAATKKKEFSVLVIEDEQILADLLKVVLEAEGYQVRNAMDRQEISTAFSKMPLPDLVLLDLVLPGVDGFDVLRKIRQHPLLMHLPVVILTAKATRDAVLKGLSCGADGYLTKPFEIPILIKAVRAVLGLPEDG